MKRNMLLNFNTSHVVVYRETVMVRSNMHEQFQYISCCSLSCVYNGRRKLLLNFNTSHVVVYPTYDGGEEFV